MRKYAALAAAIAVSLVAAAPAMAYSYPPVARQQFVHACLENGAPLKGCECVINYIQAHESLSALNRQVVAYENGGPVPQVEVTAARHCGMQIL